MEERVCYCEVSGIIMNGKQFRHYHAHSHFNAEQPRNALSLSASTHYLPTATPMLPPKPGELTALFSSILLS